MDKENFEIFDATVSYEDSVPLSWHLRGEDEPLHFAGLNVANEETLRILLLLNEAMPDSGDEELRMPELQRLDLKINIVLDLVAQLITRATPLPQTYPIRIAATGLEWRQTQPLAIGEQGIIEVYMDKKYPRPLRLAVQVGAVEKVAEEFKISVRYEQVSELVKVLLEKVVFKRHRRHIAHIRRIAPK